MATTETRAARYFICKCTNFNALYTAKETSVWACSDRTQGPQPRDFLTDALKEQPVVLLYSVNNCHGWHGYAAMVTSPGNADVEELYISAEEQNKSDGIDVVEPASDQPLQNDWHRFRIKWLRLYLWEHGEQCLPFTATENLVCLDGTPLNKARNLQEVSTSVGLELCSKIDQDYEGLTQKRKQREEERTAPVTPFFQPCQEVDAVAVWQKLLGKVEGLGTVLLACVFGSQRYNLHRPGSDVDMFVVYQAPSCQVLGFHPPSQTIKNRDVESCDYTIHEVYRYCELLLAGDARCVETLFLHPSSVTHSSQWWRHLCAQRHTFLTAQCLDKYLRDATGSKGTKQLAKWEATGETSREPLPAKVCKLSYIVLRLLQNARDVTAGELNVYREGGSAEQDLLMGVRSGSYTYAKIQEEIHRMLAEIADKRAELDSKTTEQSIETLLTDCLLKLRYESLQQSINGHGLGE